MSHLCLLKVPFWHSCWVWPIFLWRSVPTCIVALALKSFGRTRWLAPWRWAGLTLTITLRPGRRYYGMHWKDSNNSAPVKVVNSQHVNKTAVQSGLMEFSVFILFREKLGNRVLIKTARDELSPKVRILQSPWYCWIDETTAAKVEHPPLLWSEYY